MVPLKGEALPSPMRSEGNGEKGNQLENGSHVWIIIFFFHQEPAVRFYKS